MSNVICERLWTARRLIENGNAFPVEISEDLEKTTREILQIEPRVLILSSRSVLEVMKAHPRIAHSFEEATPNQLAWAFRLATEKSS